MLDLARIKVCFLAGTLGQGGAERQLFYMLKVLRERKAQVRLLSLTSGEFWEDKLRELDVPIEWVGQTPSRLPRLKNILASLLRERPDILQSQHFYVNPYAAAAGSLTRLKSIGAIRSDMTNEVNLENPTLRKWGLKYCSVVAANSKAAIQRAIEFGLPQKKLMLLPNVVDTDEFRPGDPTAREGCFTILAVGRMVPPKRYDRLLSVMAHLTRICSQPLRLVFAGDGPCRGDLEKQAKAMGLTKIQFLGQGSDLAGVYRAADVLAISSDYEGTPNVALEAMACGLPVVSTNVGGMADLIEHGVTGYLAGREDEEALAGHLKTLAEDCALLKKMSANARLHVVENYSLKRLPLYLEELYGNVLSV